MPNTKYTINKVWNNSGKVSNGIFSLLFINDCSICVITALYENAKINNEIRTDISPINIPSTINGHLIKPLEKEKKELAESKKSVQDKQAKVKVAKDKKEAKVANLTAEQKKLQTQINNYNKEIQKLEEELAKAANDYNNSYTGKFVGTLSWPLSKSSPGYKTITSYYGNRQVPIAGATSNHRAIDIGVPTGTPVLSAGNGIVISTGYNSARGYFVIIKHADNLYTLYQHLSKILVSRGQAVSTGKTIAKSGSSGIGTGPHLHFEVRKSQYYGSEVNPLDYCHW